MCNNQSCATQSTREVPADNLIGQDLLKLINTQERFVYTYRERVQSTPTGSEYSLHLQRASSVYSCRELVQSTHTGSEYSLHLQRASTVYTYRERVQSTPTGSEYSLHLQRASTVYTYRELVQFATLQFYRHISTNYTLIAFV